MPITKLRPSFTFTEDRLHQLKAVVPEAFADGKLDLDVLREALGDHLEDEEIERFGLFWPGKREARRLASMPSKGTLIPVPGEGVNEDTTRNVFIEGENLEVLKLLLKGYAGRVKMIYIDPPYNTGNDFIYSDDYSEPLVSYLRKTGQLGDREELLTTNSKASGRFHSNWLTMMYPRLQLARALLSGDGLIFVSIGNDEFANLIQVLDEVFGEENQLATIVVQSNPRGRQQMQIAETHEYLLIYAKDLQEVSVGVRALTEEQKGEYKKRDSDGNLYREIGLRKRGAAARREDVPNLYFPIYINPDNGRVALERSQVYREEALPVLSGGEDGRWRWGKARVRDRADTLLGRVVAEGRWDVFERDYLQQEGADKGTKFKSVWLDKDLNYEKARQELKDLFDGVAPFDYPKPTYLLRSIISLVDDTDCLVLDFFAGSCTTPHALLAANLEDAGTRAFIAVQLPEEVPADGPALGMGLRTVADVGKERIRRAIGRLGMQRSAAAATEEKNPALSFRVLKLARSNFREWNDYEGNEVRQYQIDLAEASRSPLVEGWKTEYVIVEIMLQQGFPLDASITSAEEYAANSVLRVRSDHLVSTLYICLDGSIAAETAEAISRLGEKDIFICLDSALTDEAKIRLSDTANLYVV